MRALLIFPGYFVWHYSIALRDIWHVWMNVLWFIAREFSIVTLLGSLFSPWRRVVEAKPEHFDLEKYAEAFVANIMSRIVGAVLRFCIIIVGSIIWLLALCGGVLFYALWLAAPGIVVVLCLAGSYFAF